MLKLQIRELCILRGIKTPLVALRKGGISQKVANQYLTGQKKHILLKHIEILCKLLRCAPNDLFAWTPDNKAEDIPENPLQAIRQRALPDLQKVIGGLSLEEVRRRLEN
ncbi:MAG: helix-turn-helix transcriptional regulator [Bacteroidota bacterium]